MTGVNFQEEKLKIDYKNVDRRESNKVVAYEDDMTEVKAMFKQVKRRGSKAKRQVTNMYTIEVFPEEENKKNNMLSKPEPRVDE